MLPLTKRRERHGILAGNENRILGRSACPVCTQGLLNLPDQRLPGGKYLIFTLPHTTEALAQAWAGCFDAAAAQGYTIDFRRPIMERYVKKEVDRHRCDLCLPITS